ncbi:MAG TPA: SDR family oxidoreductase [Candidatus Binatia bacterium]|nr:SDR family oxidoreductase [Candidatus Binatia bacterium]
MRMQNKVIMATSASDARGKAIVRGFAREGANCVVVDRDASKAEQLAAEARSLGVSALPLQFDVTKKSQIEEAVSRAIAEFGRIDVLLNCSGITNDSHFLELTEESFNLCLDCGPKAYFLACQAVGRYMAEQRSGKMINLATTDARTGSGESTGNSAAYSGIDAMTRAAAQALGFYGINVNALVCGPMDDRAASSEEVGERLRRIPLGRLGKPEDLVGAAIFLATEDSIFVCGESLYVDAGYSNAAVTEDSFRPTWARTWGRFDVPPRKD